MRPATPASEDSPSASETAPPTPPMHASASAQSRRTTASSADSSPNELERLREIGFGEQADATPATFDPALNAAVLQRLMSSHRIAFACLDEHLRIKLASPRLTAFLETETQELIGSLVSDVFLEFFGAEDALRDILVGKIPNFHLSPIMRQTNDEAATHLAFTVLPFAVSEFRLLVLVEDITATELLEQRLAQSRNELRLLQSQFSRAHDELDLQYRRWEALADLELTIDQPHELQSVLDRIVAISVELLPASDGARIILWDAASELFSIGSSTLPGETPRMIVQAVWNQGRASRWIVDRRQPCIVPNAHDDPFGDGRTRRLRAKAYVGVPLMAGEEVLGALYALDRQPRQYTQKEVGFMTALAKRAAVVMLNARRFGEVHQLATTDSLTGVNNRRHFLALAEHEFQRARRLRQPLSTIMLDFDLLKNINDRYGHAIGDQVLRVISERCQRSIRDTDILGRYGGEEFVILLPETDLRVARHVAERLRKDVAETSVPTSAGELRITISLGVAGAGEDTSDFAMLLQRADQALYAAKQAGRNRVKVASPRQDMGA